MLDCKYKICQWPDCDKTCGLNPVGDYSTGAALIHHLQNEIQKKDKTLSEVYSILGKVKTDIFKDIIPLEEALGVITAEYESTCPLGYTDCFNDPGWLKYWDYDEWKKDGCPMVCSYYKENMGYLCPEYYNSEDDM